jgi:chromosome segregation ATPase
MTTEAQVLLPPEKLRELVERMERISAERDRMMEKAEALRQALEAARGAQHEVEDQAHEIRRRYQRSEEARREAVEELTRKIAADQRAAAAQVRGFEERLSALLRDSRDLALQNAALLRDKTDQALRAQSGMVERADTLGAAAVQVGRLAVELDRLLKAAEQGRVEREGMGEELAAARGALSAAETEREHLRREADALRSELERMRGRGEEQGARIANLAGENEGLRRRVASAEEVLAAAAERERAVGETVSSGIDRARQSLEEAIREARSALAVDAGREERIHAQLMALRETWEHEREEASRALPLLLPETTRVREVSSRGRRVVLGFLILLLFFLTFFTGYLALHSLGARG